MKNSISLPVFIYRLFAHLGEQRAAILKAMLVPLVLWELRLWLMTMVAADQMWAEILIALLTVLVPVYLAVSMHRLMLLGAPGYLRRPGAEDVLYLLALLLLGLPAFIFAVIVGFFSALFYNAGRSGGVPLLFAYGAATVFIARMSLLLPAVAVGQRPDVRQAWQLGRGHTFHALFVLVFVPLALISLPYLLIHIPGISMAVIAALNALCEVLALSIVCVGLALLYREAKAITVD